MRVRILLASVACLLLAALPMVAQGVPTGSVSGQVASAEGTPLPGVTVTLRNQESKRP